MMAYLLSVCTACCLLALASVFENQDDVWLLLFLLLLMLLLHMQSFRSAFDVAGWREACTRAAGGMREQVAAFRELLDHCSEVRVWM
jgi:hypothetical protein